MVIFIFFRKLDIGDEANRDVIENKGKGGKSLLTRIGRAKKIRVTSESSPDVVPSDEKFSTPAGVPANPLTPCLRSARAYFSRCWR